MQGPGREPRLLLRHSMQAQGPREELVLLPPHRSLLLDPPCGSSCASWPPSPGNGNFASYTARVNGQGRCCSPSDSHLISGECSFSDSLWWLQGVLGLWLRHSNLCPGGHVAVFSSVGVVKSPAAPLLSGCVRSHLGPTQIIQVVFPF